MNIVVPHTLGWPAKYGDRIRKQFATRARSEGARVTFIKALKEILKEERAVYDPDRLSMLILTPGQSLIRFLRAVQWECWIRRFAKLQTFSAYRSLIEDDTLNLRFEELLLMSDDGITAWIDRLRHRFAELWDASGMPPLYPFDPIQTVDQFLRLRSAKPKTFDDDCGSRVLSDETRIVASIRPFFPAMSKTRINHDGVRDEEGSFVGFSLYDLFASPSRRNALQLGFRRQFRRDSMKSFSHTICPTSPYSLGATTGATWVPLFAKSSMANDCGYWLWPVTSDANNESSSYSHEDTSECLRLEGHQMLALHESQIIPDNALANIAPSKSSLEKHLPHSLSYFIRFYKKSTQLFPKGLRMLQIAYDSPPSNFSPVIAKNLYERYTEHVKYQPVLNVYDTSAGWGGRIAGAMAVAQDRRIHYLGTDPNTRNVLADSDVTCYENLARFINYTLELSDPGADGTFFPHTFEIFRVGSEVIENEERFRQYKGKLDLVLSSPPYFSRELYSEDDTQSCNKFPTYDEWREGFLRPTLVTAYTYLRRERYLLWNVGDVRLGDVFGTIEQDSIDILTRLGAQLVRTEWMALSNMPGSDRVNKDGTATAVNSITLEGKVRKAEPIYVFWKP